REDSRAKIRTFASESGTAAADLQLRRNVVTGSRIFQNAAWFQDVAGAAQGDRRRDIIRSVRSKADRVRVGADCGIVDQDAWPARECRKLGRRRSIRIKRGGTERRSMSDGGRRTAGRYAPGDTLLRSRKLRNEFRAIASGLG